MQIRDAKASDIPAIVRMGSRSLQDGPYAGVIADNPEQAKRCIEEVMQKGGILLGEEDGEVVGLLGYLLANHHFSGEPYAAELMWYVAPEHRKGGIALKLLWEAEARAKQAGAKSMVFTAPNNDVAALYKRFGYSPLEVTFRKVF